MSEYWDDGIFQLLDQIADDLDGQKRVVEPYSANSEHQFEVNMAYVDGWNDAIEHLKKYLRDGAQMIRS